MLGRTKAMRTEAMRTENEKAKEKEQSVRVCVMLCVMRLCGGVVYVVVRGGAVHNVVNTWR